MREQQRSRIPGAEVQCKKYDNVLRIYQERVSFLRFFITTKLFSGKL